MMDRSYLFVPGNRPERRADLDLTRHLNGFTLMLDLKLTPQMSFAAVSEGESFSVVNGGAARAEVFSDSIGTSMCQGANARDRR